MQLTTLLPLLLAPLTSALVLPRTSVSDACAPLPLGSGPSPNKNTTSAFLHYGAFSTLCTIAAAPSGYQRTFHNQLAATSGANYMGYYTLSTGYDVNACAALCTDSQGCQGFNVYFERDPTVNPAPACANPAPTTNVKCSLFGAPPTQANVTNAGQWRQEFQVVIAGSNGYAKIGSVPANTQDYGVNPYN